jgi:hypothetical protein
MPAPPPVPPPRPVLNYGVAGESARKEFERRHERHQRQIEQNWGPLAGVVKRFSPDPQSTAAWAEGTRGEERLAKGLLEGVGDRAIFLNDLKMPRTRANIDLIAICPSGIWIIDAKDYKGLIEHRDVGGWFRRDVRLYVRGRDRSKLTDGLSSQVQAVRAVVGDPEVPIHSAPCFVNSDSHLFARPFRHNGVWIIWRRKLGEMLLAPGPLGFEEATDIASRLVAALGRRPGAAS